MTSPVSGSRNGNHQAHVARVFRYYWAALLLLRGQGIAELDVKLCLPGPRPRTSPSALLPRRRGISPPRVASGSSRHRSAPPPCAHAQRRSEKFFRPRRYVYVGPTIVAAVISPMTAGARSPPRTGDNRQRDLRRPTRSCDHPDLARLLISRTLGCDRLCWRSCQTRTSRTAFTGRYRDRTAEGSYCDVPRLWRRVGRDEGDVPRAVASTYVDETRDSVRQRLLERPSPVLREGLHIVELARTGPGLASWEPVVSMTRYARAISRRWPQTVQGRAPAPGAVPERIPILSGIDEGTAQNSLGLFPQGVGSESKRGWSR